MRDDNLDAIFTNAAESAETDAYKAFVDKFGVKKTTDDCYTPGNVYDAVADYVAGRYNLDRANFVRPFYPGGDYQREVYKPGDVVVDNPPFSLLAEIVYFYQGQQIPFFIFAPALTSLFNRHYQSVCAVCCGVSVTYANKAVVSTSFLTNLEPTSVRARSAPDLYKAVDEANKANLRAIKKALPKYVYDKHVITCSYLNSLSMRGVDYQVPRSRSAVISELSSMGRKGIFGNGLLIGDSLMPDRERADRERADRERADRERAYTWELREREREIIHYLDNQAI